MTLTLSTLHSCREAAQTTQQEQPAEQMPWILDKFDDIKVLRYEVPGFENLPLEQKELIYYLAQATKCGRDILFDQNFKYNLTIRRTLESIYTKYEGDRTTAEFKSLEKYLKKVWFANGIHHHYSNDKFRAEFPRAWFAQQVDKYVDPQELKIEKELLYKIIFDETLYATRLNQKDGVDMVTESACNYYEGVTMKEVDKFYSELIDENDPRPISYGLNSKLMKDDSGKIVEQTWKLGGMYSAAIQQIVFWLEKAAGVAQEPQKSIINALINYYRTGDLREFDRYNILWVGDNVSNVDFVNGFIEDYGDPLGRKASWEGTVNFMDSLACRRTQILSKNAQWFEDNAPIDPAFRKKEVKGVSAKVITVAMLGGDCYPSTPIGINLPNADWIRKEYGSKSVTIDNITYAYDKAAQGNGFNEEFMLRGEDRER
ncbi:MAG: dihydrofolate reductase, partial [Alistipes sp.]|nr:dihydrofolate reductase [Alistipes sp.]